MGELDVAARAALRIAPGGLVRLGWGSGARLERRLERELVTTLRARDALFSGRLGGERTLFHVEVEASPRRRTPRRVFEYRAQAVVVYRMPVRSLVIYLRRGRWQGPLERAYRLHDGAGRPVELAFDVLPLWATPVAQVLSRGEAGLLPFVPFLHGARPAHARRALELLRRARLADPQRADLCVALAVCAGRAFPGQGWLGTLSEEERMASSTYREILELGAQQGLDHLRTAILDVVRNKIGRCPRGLADRLARIEDGERLRRLVVRLGCARTAGEVRGALAEEASEGQVGSGRAIGPPPAPPGGPPAAACSRPPPRGSDR